MSKDNNGEFSHFEKTGPRKIWLATNYGVKVKERVFRKRDDGRLAIEYRSLNGFDYSDIIPASKLDKTPQVHFDLWIPPDLIFRCEAFDPRKVDNLARLFRRELGIATYRLSSGILLFGNLDIRREQGYVEPDETAIIYAAVFGPTKHLPVPGLLFNRYISTELATQIAIRIQIYLALDKKKRNMLTTAVSEEYAMVGTQLNYQQERLVYSIKLEHVHDAPQKQPDDSPS